MRDFVSRVDQAVRAKPVEGSSSVMELVNSLHQNKSNMILIPSRELASISDVPCASSLYLTSIRA